MRTATVALEQWLAADLPQTVGGIDGEKTAA